VESSNFIECFLQWRWFGHRFHSTTENMISLPDGS
jgi:hypothetical protein